MSRRDFLRATTGAALAVATGVHAPAALAEEPSSKRRVPRAPTALGLCQRYEFGEVRRVLGGMLEALGGVRRLVRRKHVTVKTTW